MYFINYYFLLKLILLVENIFIKRIGKDLRFYLVIGLIYYFDLLYVKLRCMLLIYQYIKYLILLYVCNNKYCNNIYLFYNYLMR